MRKPSANAKLKVRYSSNKKMKPHYLGPLIIISRNKGGTYILCKLDGIVLHRPIAAYRVLPYLAKRTIYFLEFFSNLPSPWCSARIRTDCADSADSAQTNTDSTPVRTDPHHSARIRTIPHGSASFRTDPHHSTWESSLSLVGLSEIVNIH